MAKQEKHEAPEPATVHTVSVGGHDLALRGEGTEARIRDLDLARVLEFTDQHMIRRLIRRHVEAGRIHPLSVTVTETGGRPGTEYWLTKREALWITAHSGTPKAESMLQEVIDVFVLAEEGKLPIQQEAAAAIIALRHDLADMRRLLQSHVEAQAVLGKTRAENGIMAPIRELARLLARTDPAFSLRSHQSRVTSQIKAEHGWSYRRWEDLPAGRLGPVQSSILERQHAAGRRDRAMDMQKMKARKEADLARQTELHFAPGDKPS